MQQKWTWCILESFYVFMNGFMYLGVFNVLIWELFYVLVANSDPWSHTTKMKLFLPLLSTTILLIKVTCDPIQQGQGNFKFIIPPHPPNLNKNILVRVYHSDKKSNESNIVPPSSTFKLSVLPKGQIKRFDILDFKQRRINNYSLKCLSLGKSIDLEFTHIWL